MKKKTTKPNGYAPRESTVFTEFSEQNRFGRGITTVIVVCGVVVVLAVFIAVLVRMFFRVDSIVVDGVNYYGYETLLEKAGLSKGHTIFTVSEKKIKERLTKSLPYVHDVSVELKFPSSVHMVITEEVPAFFFEMDGEFFLINDEMKVLDRYSDEKILKEENPDVMLVKIPEVRKAITSKKVEFVSDFESRHTYELLYAISEWKRFDKLTDINAENRFDVRLVYEGRLELRFGSFTDFADKLALAERMIDYYPSDTSGVFILDDVNEGIARIDGDESG